MTMRTITLLAILSIAWKGAVSTGAARAAEIDTERLAQALSSATVTVRVTVPPDTGVTISSGVSLGDGFVVTYSNHPGNADFRLTLPDGAQSKAEARVIDVYSGLSLLELVATSQERLPDKAAARPRLSALTPAEESPAVGAVILKNLSHGASYIFLNFFKSSQQSFFQ